MKPRSLCIGLAVYVATRTYVTETPIRSGLKEVVKCQPYSKKDKNVKKIFSE